MLNRTRSDPPFSVYSDLNKFLRLGSDYPLSPLYDNRNLLKKLSEDHTQQPIVNIVGRTAIIHDTTLRLDDVGDMFRALLKEISDEERGITQGLFDTDPRLQFNLPTELSDEPNNTRIDFSFEDLPRNGLTGRGNVMTDIVLHHPRFRGRYIFPTGNGGFSCNPAACYELLYRFAHLRALLFSATHISYGGPARGTEIAAHHLRNAPGGDVRNVKILGGKVCFVGGYNKTTHQVRNIPFTTNPELMDPQTEQQKVIYRFPPHDLVPFLVREWVLYRPLQVLIARMLDQEDMAHRLRYLVFPGLHKPLETADLSDMLRASTMDHVGYEIGLRDWRQIESNFVLALLKRRTQASVEPAGFDQSGHTAHIANTYYRRQPEDPNGVNPTMIAEDLDSSEVWQRLTGKPPAPRSFCSVLMLGRSTGILKPPTPQPGPVGSSAQLIEQTVELHKQMSGMMEDMRSTQKAIPSTVQRAVALATPNVSTFPPRDPRPDVQRIDPHASNLAKLRNFRKDEEAQFTCPEQAEALEAVLGGPGHVFLIGPTGMGKTSVFLIPATESPHEVTVVLLPLSALRIDFSRRCATLGISCSEWAPNNPSETTIVMVSPEDAVKPLFLRWAVNRRLKGTLVRFVYDEVHMAKTQSCFRSCFSAHRRLIELGEHLPLHHASQS